MKLLKWVRSRWNSAIESTTPLTPLEELFLSELKERGVKRSDYMVFVFYVGRLRVLVMPGSEISVSSEGEYLGELPHKYVHIIFEQIDQQEYAEQQLRINKLLEARNETKKSTKEDTSNT